MARPLTAADRVPQVGDVLLAPPHPKDRRQGRPEKLVGAVDKFDNVRVLILPRHPGSRYADVVSEDKWAEYAYQSRQDGGPITIEDY